MRIRLNTMWLSSPLLLLLSAGSPATQCDDTIDNNSNGLVDMADWYCKAPFDNDETSFGSGLPNDLNLPKSLDCWFDTDSGSGNDGCSMHACCDIAGSCPADLDPADFHPDQCGAVTQACRDVCLPLTKPGCDCFGCCEICVPGSACANVFVNPAVSPACTVESINDPSACRTCTPNPSCLVLSHIFVDGFEPAPLLQLSAALRAGLH